MKVKSMDFNALSCSQENSSHFTFVSSDISGKIENNAAHTAAVDNTSVETCDSLLSEMSQ